MFAARYILGKPRGCVGENSTGFAQYPEKYKNTSNLKNKGRMGFLLIVIIKVFLGSLNC